MYTNENKRITKLVRIDPECHAQLKILAKEHHNTISRFVSRICRQYFEEIYPKEKAELERRVKEVMASQTYHPEDSVDEMVENETDTQPPVRL